MHQLIATLLATAIGAGPVRSASDQAIVRDHPPPPPNQSAAAVWDSETGDLRLRYNDQTILEIRAKSADAGAVRYSEVLGSMPGVTQRITLRGQGLKLTGTVRASVEAFPCETCGAAQQKLPLVRTSHGLSRSLRNNAVYDRRWDWELELPADGTVRILPLNEAAESRTFSLSCTGGNSIELVFRPHFYQKHKNIRFFEPWTYRLPKECVAGWCSWWAYRQDFNEQQYRDLVRVWGEKHLPDFGYRVLQIDDAYQQGAGGIGTPGTVKSWLEWNERFPGGKEGYVRLARSIGAEAGVWTSLRFNDPEYVEAHPEFFIRSVDGKPYSGPWVFYGLDATIPEVADNLVRPIYRGFKQAGFTYLKVDTVRHLLYDNAQVNPGYAKSKGIAPADIVRRYFEAVREEVGPDVFVLACWGVLPEVVGLADGCRLGGDGYGPSTLQQYNSWNGVVWYNDPDHCDVRPATSPEETGNVSAVRPVASNEREAILRPTLASVAGAMLLLSDRSEIYRDEVNLRGAKRTAPILPTVPGQLYDFDPTTSDKIKTVDAETITSGADESPYDARQFGTVCQWWLNEIDRPFEHWTVLTRMNWTDGTLPAARVKLADLGLDATRDYLVYEFWTKKYLGVRAGDFEAPASEPKVTHTFAIREKLDHPQLVSTSRHISQGGVDLGSVEWKDNVLQGRSVVIIDDRYELVVRMPRGYSLKSARFGDRRAETSLDGELVRVAFTPTATGETPWKITFSQTKWRRQRAHPPRPGGPPLESEEPARPK